VSEFLVESYISRADPVDVDERAERARVAAEALTREGTPVRYLRSIFVPDDEICFYLYEARSADGVREAASRAALAFERITEAVGETEGEAT
jgi:Protein of unknown function (DUF4242)